MKASTEMPSQWGRRDALRLSSGLFVAGSLVGCDVFSTKPAGSGSRAAHKGEGKTDEAMEAPALAQQVKSGDLPPVAKRLPKNPLPVAAVDSAGHYGDTLHLVMNGVTGTAWMTRTIAYEGLMRWTVDGSEVIPNIAQAVRRSTDGRQYTIELREGMKWSDGEPFTADDLLFAWNDVLRNKDLTPVMPAYMLSRDTPGDIEKLDDHTVRVTFAHPSGLFGTVLAYDADTLTHSPRHYLQDFHPKYNPDAEQEAKKQHFSSWPELFWAKADIYANGDLPHHYAWTLTTVPGEGRQVVADRNPYYFKTDPAGRQLPYIDTVTYDVIDDAEVMLLKATNGEIDLETLYVSTSTNKPVLARNREKGHYHFNTRVSTLSNEMVIALNLAHKDPTRREIFQNKDFRIGLSYAINRNELIAVAFQHQGEPHQPAPVRESAFFEGDFAKQYTEHDVDKANQHLDAAGYSRRDAAGFRLGPDDRRISFQIDVSTAWPYMVDAMELVVDYWKDVGIEARVKNLERSLFGNRAVANEYDANVYEGDGGLAIEVLEPRWYFPFSSASYYATPWATWFTSRGKDGEKPPPAARKQMELYWRLLETPDKKGRSELFKQILQIAKEEFYAIGTVRIPETYAIVADGLQNVPKRFLEAWLFRTPAFTDPEQYYVR